MKEIPVLKILIPIIIGVITALIGYQWFNIKIEIIWIIATICFVTTITLFIYSNKKKRTSTPFILSFSAFFFVISLGKTLNSINEAKNIHGDNWKYSVYKDNKMESELAENIQFKIHNFFNDKGVEGEEGALIEAVTIGYKQNLSKETRNNFSKSGVSHFIALSGYHIGIIYAFLQILFLSHILKYKWKMVSNLLILVIIWLYTIISGMSPSIVRAAIMCTIMTISSLYAYDAINMNALCISALICIVINPLIIMHVGFQLSYISMLGIYFIGIPLCKYYEPFTIIDKFIWGVISISISCTIVTLPIVSNTFGTIALMSIPSSLIMSVIVIILYVSFGLWIFSGEVPLLTDILLKTSNITLRTTNYIANMPYSSLNYKFSIYEVILYYTILLIILIFLKNYTYKNNDF